jgi:hypothetical protein
MAAVISAASDPLPYLHPILAIAILISCGAAVLAGESIWHSRHGRALEREAQELGLSFAAEGRPFEGSNVRGLPLLQGDSSVEASNVMQTMIDGREALVFDLPSCEICETEPPHQPFTTVVAFRCPEGKMPEFEIGRKDLISKVGDALWQKAAVIEDLEFAKEFFVHCPEPKKVHDWLTPAKLAKLRSAAAPFHVSANADWILIFRPRAQILPAEIPAFLRESSRIAAALLQ